MKNSNFDFAARVGLVCIFVVVIAVCFSAQGVCVDWLAVHEQANARDLKGAVAAYEQQPQSREALYRLAVVYLELYENAKAQEVVDRLSAIDDRLPQARWARAELLRRAHRNEESSAILEKLIKEHPEYMLPYVTLGFVRYAQVRFDDAAALAAAVIRRGQAGIDAVYYPRAYVLYAGAKGMIAFKGGLLSRIINGPKVLAYIRRAERLRSNCSAAWWGYGTYYLLAPRAAGGNVEKAKIYLERLIAAEPLFPEAYARMAQVYQAKGDLAQYQRYLDRAFELDHGNELALDIKANTCNFGCVEWGAR